MNHKKNNQTMINFVAPGKHLLADFFDASHLVDEQYIKKALCDAAIACGATVINVMLHHFGDGAGVTGVALLAESHISIHTWPETHFAAIDIFMCGKCNPEKAIPILQAYFKPERTTLRLFDRGESGQN